MSKDSRIEHSARTLQTLSFGLGRWALTIIPAVSFLEVVSFQSLGHVLAFAQAVVLDSLLSLLPPLLSASVYTML